MPKEKDEVNVEALRRALGTNLERNVSILRQVVYKELQMWKRLFFQLNPPDNILSVNGEIWKEAELTDGDRQFIDTQLQWFIMGEIKDDLVIAYAKSVLADLNSQTSLTMPQDKLRSKLASALGEELGVKLKNKAKMEDALSVGDDNAPPF